MATFAIIAEHPPELCPTSNAQTRQMMNEGAAQIPQLAEQLGVVVPQVGDEVAPVEQQRSLGEEQADRVLHGVDVVDEVMGGDELEQLDDVGHGRPGRERQERGADLDALLAQQRHRSGRVGRGVTLVEPPEDVVVQALEGGDDEEAPGGRQLGPDALVTQDELDLGRAVEREVGKARVNGEKKPLYRANYAFSAVELGRGENDVEIYYAPDSLKLGIWLGVASLVAGAVFFALSLREP